MAKTEITVVKGTLLNTDSSLGRAIVFALLSIFCLLLFLFREMPDYIHTHNSDKLLEVIGITLFMVAMTLLMYWLAIDNFYFFEFHKDHLVVKNWLKNYNKKFDYNNIEKINLYGHIYTDRLMGRNSIDIVIKDKSNSINKFSRYCSYCLAYKEWVVFLSKLDELGIKYDDPSGRFFATTNFMKRFYDKTNFKPTWIKEEDVE